MSGIAGWLAMVSVLAWAGHASLLLLLLACGAITWWTARRPPPTERRWAFFWASVPWLATGASGLVVGVAAHSIYEPWALGLERGWSSVHTIAPALAERLRMQWLSSAVALGAWLALASWPSALGMAPSGRAKLVLGLLCAWMALGVAAWSSQEYLALLPQVTVPTFLPFEALEPARTKFARGVIAACVGLGVGAALVARALWDAPASAGAVQRWLGTGGVVLLAGAAIFGLEPLGSRLAWENAHPIDTRFAFANCGLCIPPPLALEGRGPELMGDGPLVVLDPKRPVIDGERLRSPEELYDVLKHKRELWRQLHPKEHFPGNVVLNARKLGTLGELEAGFRSALRAGYSTADVAYSEVLRQTRPILGEVAGRRDTARRVALASWRGDCPLPRARPVHLGAESKRIPATWLEALGVKQGETVCVLLPEQRCPASLMACRGVRESGFEVVQEWTLGKRLEAVLLSREREEYLVALVAPKSAIHVELMNDADDPWDGFEALAERKHRAGRQVLWAMNAGMYHRDRRPVGLLISNSQERAPLNTSRGQGNFFLLPNGVFDATPEGARVLSTSVWQDDVWVEPSAATQSGPLLVIDGELHPAFERESTSRLIRNGIGVVRDSEVVVMAISTTPVNFHEFGSFMRNLGCADALYLDGNVSSVFAPGAGRRDPGLGLGPVIWVDEGPT